MTDPRNVAHDKKVAQEKKHQGQAVSPDADEAIQPGKKPHQAHHAEKPVTDDPASEGKDGEDVPKT